MNICLHNAANRDDAQDVTLQITERLPEWIASAPEITCRYQVKKEGRVHVLHFTASGVLVICCQRCLQSVDYSYTHAHELAVCANEEDAEHFMSVYDCVVGEQGEINLLEVLTDELLLSAPQIPHAVSDCALFVDLTWLK
jgi:uncharacterized protein